MTTRTYTEVVVAWWRLRHPAWGYRRWLALSLADAIVGMGVFCAFLPAWVVTLVISVVLIDSPTLETALLASGLVVGVSAYMWCLAKILRASWRLPVELWRSEGTSP